MICLFEIGLFTLSMPLGSISFFFCHLLQRTSCQVQHSSPWMSYRDLFFWQKSCCNPNWSESLTISEARMGMNNIESYLSQFQHFSYNFSFMSSVCLKKNYTLVVLTPEVESSTRSSWLAAHTCLNIHSQARNTGATLQHPHSTESTLSSFTNQATHTGKICS